MRSLAEKTILGFAQLIIVMSIALFGVAGSINFWQAWVYLLTFLGSSGAITVYLWQKDPKLLERRINAGPAAEQQTTQKVIQALAAGAFIGTLVLPAVDHRFYWSDVPVGIVILGDILVVLGFFVVFEVFKENTFTSATIAVAAEQKVISSGPYASVRHPLYAGALLMLLGTPLALGSWWGLLMCVPMTLVITWRLLEEEQFLSKNLPGYDQYRRKVRYRLIPLVW